MKTIIFDVFNRISNGVYSIVLHKNHKNDEFSNLVKVETSENVVTAEDLKEHFMKYQKDSLIVGVLFALIAIHCVAAFFTLLYSIVNLDLSRFSLGVFYILFWLIFPIATWIYSTKYDVWNYYAQKTLTLTLCFTSAALIGLNMLSLLYGRYIVPLIFRFIKVNREISEVDVVNLSRGLLAIINVIVLFWLYDALFDIISNDIVYANIMRFKVLKLVDVRENREYAYDFSVVRRMDTGAKHVVKENDRYLHILADGTTGTGKTSSLILPAIADDLDQKLKNTDVQKKELMRMLNEGRVRIKRPFTDDEFNINLFEPITDGTDKKQNKKNLKDYNYLKYKVQSAGLVVFAPNAELADAVYEMASNRGIKNINRIDPELVGNDERKPGSVGFNPFFLSPELKGKRWDVEVENAANIFAEVLKALYEMNGKGDPYFTELNKTITKNTAKLLILTHSSLTGGEIPNPTHVQNLVGNFMAYKDYVKELCKLYGANGGPLTQSQYLQVSQFIDSYLSKQERGKQVTYEGKLINCGQWQNVYNFVWNDILGAKGPELFDRAQGLRNQMDSFLSHALIRDVLTTPSAFNFDTALENGDITIVNYAYTLGNDVSTAFGLFLLLTFQRAVFRRPGDSNTRIGCLTYVDELPLILHPSIEQFFSLGRQYRLAMFVAMQTLDQMEKNDSTRYLKGVLLGNCAQQIVFGRISPTEMQLYNKMAGQVYRTVQQQTVSETALSTDDPHYSYSVRETPTLTSVVEGYDLRYKDFLEVTFFTVDSGSPAEPFAGKVNFLESYRRKGSTHFTADWLDLYYQQDGVDRFIDRSSEISDAYKRAPYITNVFTDYGEEKKNRITGFSATGDVFLNYDPEQTAARPARPVTPAEGEHTVETPQSNGTAAEYENNTSQSAPKPEREVFDIEDDINTDEEPKGQKTAPGGFTLPTPKKNDKPERQKREGVNNGNRKFY